MLLSLLHRTRYAYDRPVRLGPQEIRLRPMPGTRAPIVAYALRLDPAPVMLHWQTDAFGNLLARAVLPDATPYLNLEVDLVADLSPQDPFAFLLTPAVASWPFRYPDGMEDDLAPYRRPDHAGAALHAMRAETLPGDTVTTVIALARRVLDRVAYITREEAGIWPPDQTLGEGRGSCRDSAWLLVQLLRMHGIAARFVSGYLVQQDDEGAVDEGVHDAGELHAWAEAFLPGAGWIGLDATSGLLTSEGHIGLAASPHPLAAAPITGTVEPARSTLDTSMTLRRLPP